MAKVILIEPYTEGGKAGFSFAPDASKQGNQAPPYPQEVLAGYIEDRGKKEGLKISASIIQQRPYKGKDIGSEYDKDETILLTDQDIVDIAKEQTATLRDGEPLIIGIRAVTPLYLRGIEIAKKLKESIPEVKVIMGGYYPSEVKKSIFNGRRYNHYEKELKNSLKDKEVQLVDCFAVGEGEEILYEFIKTVEENKDKKYLPELLKNIEGVVYKDESKQRIEFTGRRKRMTGPDGDRNSLHLPEAKREIIVPIRNKNGKFIGSKEVPSYRGCTQYYTYPPNDEIKEMQIGYSRGCMHSCKFCSSVSQWEDGLKGPCVVTFRDPKEVAIEISNAYKKYGINYIYFSDLSINQTPVQLKNLCEEFLKMKKENGEKLFGGEDKSAIHWFALAEDFKVSQDGVEKTREYLKLMKEAGCSKLGIGIEGFTPEDMTSLKDRDEDPIERTTNILMSLKLASEEGIFTRGFTMWGNEGQKKGAAERAKALLGAQIPEGIFSDFHKLQAIVRYVYEGDGKDISNADELSNKIVEYVKNNEAFCLAGGEELNKKTRLFEIDHLRVVPITPYYSTEVGQKSKLRFYDYYRDEAGKCITDQRGNRINKLLYKNEEGESEETSIEISEKGEVIYSIFQNGEKKILSDEEIKSCVKKRFDNWRSEDHPQGMSLTEGIDNGFDEALELLNQDIPVIDNEMDIDEITNFTKRDLSEYFYSTEGYRKSMQVKIKKFPYLKSACEAWMNFLNKSWYEPGKEKLNWGLEDNSEDKEQKRETTPNNMGMKIR